jgi:hypothetical protein
MYGGVMPAHKKPANTSRSETVTVRLDPKLRYLAEIGAREQQRTLSSFIEWAVRRALTPAAMWEDEPEVSEPVGPFQPKPMWMEGLWDVDEADRFFLLAAARHDLLTIPEQRLWKLFTMHTEYTGAKITIQAFREFWNDPSINTSHLKGGE